MPWFKVDDKMHSHRKTRKVLRSLRGKRRDVAPLGLWVVAGSWSSDNLTDGFVPADELDSWDDDALALAERLVDAGLWHEDTVADEPGFRFNDWSIRNPDAASVLAKRDAESKGGSLGNHVRWHVKQRIFVPHCPLCIEEESSGTRSDTPSGTRSGPAQGTRVAGESSRPGPSRPTAAAAADARAAAAASVDEDHDTMPATVAILRQKLQAHTALRALRFDLHADQLATIERLIGVHGDQPLVDVAVRTCRTTPPVSVAAFIGTWQALPEPGQRLAVVQSWCHKPHHDQHPLSAAGVCVACVVDERTAK